VKATGWLKGLQVTSDGTEVVPSLLTARRAARMSTPSAMAGPFTVDDRAALGRPAQHGGPVRGGQHQAGGPLVPGRQHDRVRAGLPQQVHPDAVVVDRDPLTSSPAARAAGRASSPEEGSSSASRWGARAGQHVHE